MGCRLSRTLSIDNVDEEKGEAQANAVVEKKGTVSNGQSVLLRRDTPAGGLTVQDNRNGNQSGGNGILTSKPIGEVESASQADFFRMLDEKIAHGRGLDSDED